MSKQQPFSYLVLIYTIYLGIKKPTVVENKASSLRRQATSQQRQENLQSSQKPVKQKSSISKTLQTVDDTSSASKKQDVSYKFLRSKTSLDIRSSNVKQILRNEDGIPYITPIQRYELQLLLMEDVLKHGISGKSMKVLMCLKTSLYMKKNYLNVFNFFR